MIGVAGMAESELAQRVQAAVDEARVAYEASGGEPLHVPGQVAEHFEVGGSKWAVDQGTGKDDVAWEGGYVCYCGEVFARTVAEGGMKAAYEAFAAHCRAES